VDVSSAKELRKKKTPTPPESPVSRESPHIMLMTGQDEELGFDDLHVVHQEIQREDGETEIIPVVTKVPLGKLVKRKSKTDLRKGMVTKRILANTTSLHDDTIEVMKGENGVPVVVPSKNKERGNQAEKVATGGLASPQASGRWNMTDLKNTLARSNVGQIDRNRNLNSLIIGIILSKEAKE
jgi:hypothetical protein